MSEFIPLIPLSLVMLLVGINAHIGSRYSEKKLDRDKAMWSEEQLKRLRETYNKPLVINRIKRGGMK